MSTYEAELEISTLLGAEDKNLMVEVDLTLTAASVRPSGTSGPPEFYDPGSGPEFEFEDVRVIGGTDEKPITKTFTAVEFGALFPSGDLILDQAMEWAEDNEESFYEYD